MALARAYPYALKEKDDSGRLPLHCALERQASETVINELRDTNPNAAKEEDDHGKLPLHYAVEKNPSATTVMPLLDLYPAAARHRDKHGRLPQEYTSDTGIASLLKRSSFDSIDGRSQSELSVWSECSCGGSTVHVFSTIDELNEENFAFNLSELECLPVDAVQLKYKVQQAKGVSGLTVSLEKVKNEASVNVGFAKIKISPKIKTNDIGKLRLGKDTAEPKSASNFDIDDLKMPGIEKYGIRKSEAVAAAQQIAHCTGNVEMATIFLSNAAVPTHKIRDIFGDDQTPWNTADPPVLKSTYAFSPEEMIACCTVVEGIIQRFVGFKMYMSKYYGKGAPSYATFLLGDGIPHKHDFLKATKERLFGSKIGKGRKVRLMKFPSQPTVWYYAVETNKLVFCRKIHNSKTKIGNLRLDPKIDIYSTAGVIRGHFPDGFAKIPSEGLESQISHKFKVG